MKIILYICIWIVGIDPPMKEETRTPFPDTFVRESLKTGIMKTINLSQGQVALVDDEDYDFLIKRKWHAFKGRSSTIYGDSFYAVNSEWIPELKKVKINFLHRVIMKTPDDLFVDHIDHDGLNCQKSNMRNCTRTQNMQNKRSWAKSKYLGVYYVGGNPKLLIASYISVNKKLKYLGTFKTEEQAARAYDEVARKQYGEFANLNFKDEIIIP